MYKVREMSKDERTTIAINNPKIKARFDNVQRFFERKLKANLTQSEALDELLTYVEEREGVEAE